MKQLILTGAMLLVLSINGLAIEDDFNARLDDFKIQEDKKSLDEFRRKNTIDKSKELSQIQTEHPTSSTAIVQNKKLNKLKGISWIRIAPYKDKTITMEVPMSWHRKRRNVKRSERLVRRLKASSFYLVGVLILKSGQCPLFL